MGAPTPSFLSLHGGPSQRALVQDFSERYDDVCENGTTQYTNADVTSIMVGDDMGRQGPSGNETSMVQDHDLQKLIGQFKD